MANKRIDQLTELTSIDSSDLLVAYDVSEPGDEKSKKVTKTNFFSGYSTTSHDHNSTYLTISGGNITGSLSVGGDLTVLGTNFIANVEEVQVEDNTIVLNKSETGAGVTAGSAGIEIERGTETNYRFIFDETQDNFRVGMIGSLQAVATRQDSPTSNGITYWNDTDKRMDTSSTLISDIGNANKINSVTVSGTPVAGETLTYNGSIWTPSVSSYRKNIIINGNMDIWQRGTVFTGLTSSGKFGADRFCMVFSGITPTYAINQSTSLPAGTFNYSFRTTPTTADTSVGSSDWGAVRYRIEGYDIQRIMGKIMTLSFWVRHTQTGTHCISLVGGGGDRSYVIEYTINDSNTWEFKELTFTMHDGASGTWDFTNGNGLSIFWTLAAGSTFQTTKDAWQTGNYRATSSVQNFFGSTSNVFGLKQVQLEIGSIATDFDYRPIAEEIEFCQRYCEKSYDLNTAPGTATGVGAIFYEMWAGTTQPILTAFFRTRKNRAVTSSDVILYSTAGTINNVTLNAADQAATVASNGGENSFTFYPTATPTAGHNLQAHYVVDVEL